MTEDDAHGWLTKRYPGVVVARLAAFVDLVIEENGRQNLIAPGTVESIWTRHVVDSAQLADHAPAAIPSWVDIGSGAGFPGIVIAVLEVAAHVVMIEPRRRRAAFLEQAATAVGIASRVTVVASRAEVAMPGAATVISARAVAPPADLFGATEHFAVPATRYVLPRGRSAAQDIATLPSRWHGMFHVEPSITDPTSGILIADKVQRR